MKNNCMKFTVIATERMLLREEISGLSMSKHYASLELSFLIIRIF